MFYRKTHIKEILNFWPKSWVNPFAKMPIFPVFLKWPFYSRERLVLDLTYYQTISTGLFYGKLHMQYISNFWPKVTLCKTANFSTFGERCFLTLERLVFSLKPYQTVYRGMFYRKTHIKEILNFWPKSWVNPFAKMPVFLVF